MWLKYDILIQIWQAFNSKKTKKPKRKHDYITANFHNWFLLFLNYCKVNVEEVRKCSSRQKPEDTTQLWEGFFFSLRWRRRRRGRRRETAAKWACFLLLCVFLIPPNKLNSAALKRSEEGNDWPQKTHLSPNLTINRSWQTVYQHSTKCYFVL